MGKRRKDVDVAGVLEFKGRTSDDPEFIAWLAEHKGAKGGKIRVAQGGTGVRVMFSDKADIEVWKERADQASGGKRPTQHAASLTDPYGL